MTTFAPRALATGIGSLPHRDVQDALRVVFRTFPAVPYWPQLPRRDFRENMYAQFSEDLPTVSIDLPHEWIGSIVAEDVLAQAERFYDRYVAQDPNLFAIG